MASLELRNVQKSYGNSQIATLKDIALKIDAGEFLILVGPSGCGKSTLMNCIAGLENITGGEILVDGEDISQASPKDRDIAMVFQSYALYPTMSVRDNIAFGLKMRKVPAAKIEEEVARVAKLLQIEPLLERRNCPAVSSSAWPWVGRWRGGRRSICSTSRCRTSTPSCGWRCAQRSS